MDSASILPVFDLDAIGLGSSPDAISAQQLEACKELAMCIKNTGACVVRDNRVSASANDEFLDLLEQYFERSTTEKMKDTRPELHYQVGATPAGTELPRVLVDKEMQQRVEALPEGHKASMPTGPDVKWRYFRRVGPRPESTRFAELNAEPVVPEGIPQWSGVLDDFSDRLLSVATGVAECAAVGFGLDRDAFTSRMSHGPHLLAPTGTDLGAHGRVGEVLAGYHYDLNFLTIHGKSRFPGLFIWLADGRRVPVRVPEGCLLVQAGKQMEWLTGGAVAAGMHEVVVTPDTVRAVEAARAARRSVWRVSSTVFTHIASDQVLQPLGGFATPEAQAAYPPVYTGEQVQRELEVISLKKKQHKAEAAAGAAAAPAPAAGSKGGAVGGPRVAVVHAAAF